LFDEDLTVVVNMFGAKIRILFMARNVLDYRYTGNILAANERNEDTTILVWSGSRGGTAFHR